MLDKIKSIDKKILIGIGVLFLAIIGVFIYLFANKITNVERIKVTEVSEKIAPYFSEILDRNEEDGCYVTFAIEYLHGTTGKTQFSIDEVLDVIHEFFDINFTKDDATKLGLTSYMMNKGIKYDMSVGGYSYEYSRTRTDVAATPLTTYSISKIKKNNKNNFTVTFDKLYVENPYKLFNYYSDQEERNEEAVSELTKYVKGEIIPGKILKYVTKDNINDVGKIDGTIKVKFTVKDNKLKVSKIG